MADTHNSGHHRASRIYAAVAAVCVVLMVGEMPRLAAMLGTAATVVAALVLDGAFDS